VLVYVCACVHLYVCVCCVRMSKCVYVCVCACVCMCVYVHVCVRAYVNVLVCVYVCKYVCEDAYILVQCSHLPTPTWMATCTDSAT